MSQRAQFVATASRLLDEDDRTLLLLGDVGVFAFRHAAEKHPGRVLNLGCAEAAMCGFAAGLALEGWYPIVSTIDPFLARRAYEQIYLDLGCHKLGALFVGIGRDRAYKNLGPSHWDDHCGDLMRTVPGMRVVEPTSAHEVDTEMSLAAQSRSLAYVRLGA